MGRNWHKPDDYEFIDSSGKHGPATGGMLTVKERPDRPGHQTKTLMAFFNDSFHEALLAAYYAGKHHGQQEGEKAAQHAMRKALGQE